MMDWRCKFCGQVQPDDVKMVATGFGLCCSKCWPEIQKKYGYYGTRGDPVTERLVYGVRT